MAEIFQTGFELRPISFMVKFLTIFIPSVTAYLILKLRSNVFLDMTTNKPRSKFSRDWTEYGGDLRKAREGRATARPLSYRETMHVVLRSSKARGEWSFRRTKHRKNILRLVEKFSVTYDVQVLSMANVENHLHLHLKLTSREAYNAFIRAVSGAIVMTVTGVSRWTKGDTTARMPGTADKLKFWDHRPYSRIVLTLRHFFTLKDYIAENQLEGQGISRSIAWLIVEAERDRDGNPADFG